MNTEKKQGAKPFLKWPGGKRQLLKRIAPMLPKHFTKYCEPFVGGGALLFHLLNYHKLGEVLINDTNRDLMVAYVVIQQSVHQLINELEKLQADYIRTCGIMRDDWSDRRRYFERVRDEFNQQAAEFNYSQYNETWVTRAAQVIFLNKTCFNGLWRVRKRDGGFNTSFGDYDNPAICDRDNLLAVSYRLQGVYILCGDYQQVTEFVDSNTLIYLDPPYTPMSDTANFVGYSKDGWNDGENARLLNWIKELSEVRQGKVVLSSSDVDCWDSLNFKRVEVKAKRAISCKVEGREGVKELILNNY